MATPDPTDTVVSDNEEKTFRELMEQSASTSGGVRPHTPSQSSSHSRTAADRPISNAPPTWEDTDDEYMRPGLQHKEMRRLKQGKFRIDNNNRIDLHGSTRDEAYHSLQVFLDRCLNRHTRYATVICGKGIHSPTGKPVLKSAIRGWLVEHSQILAYCPAQRRDGGDGALYVLLKSKRTAD